MRKNELSYKDLRNNYNPNNFKFETTEELDNEGLIYGQERGIAALEFGLKVNSKGYNLYIEGPSGVGKTMYSKKYVAEIAHKAKTPDDWCYIYNFNEPNEPIAISLPAGQGKEFKQIMDVLVEDVKKSLKRTFNNEDFEKEKKSIKQKFQEKREKILEHLNKETMKLDFQIKAAPNGIYMLPILEGKVIDENDFDKLDDSVKQKFEANSEIVQTQIMQVIGQLKNIEKESDQKIEEWQSNIALLTINT